MLLRRNIRAVVIFHLSIQTLVLNSRKNLSSSFFGKFTHCFSRILSVLRQRAMQKRKLSLYANMLIKHVTVDVKYI